MNELMCDLNTRDQELKQQKETNLQLVNQLASQHRNLGRVVQLTSTVNRLSTANFNYQKDVERLTGEKDTVNQQHSQVVADNRTLTDTVARLMEEKSALYIELDEQKRLDITWVRMYDNSFQEWYFFNSATQESSWVDPRFREQATSTIGHA